MFNDFLCHVRQRHVVLGLPRDGQWRDVDPLWHVVPGMFRWFDFPDLLSSLAGRPLIMTEGGARQHLDQVRRAYRERRSPHLLEIHHYPRYADPAARIHDDDEIPEGLTMEEYFTYANVDVPKPQLQARRGRAVAGAHAERQSDVIAWPRYPRTGALAENPRR